MSRSGDARQLEVLVGPISDPDLGRHWDGDFRPPLAHYSAAVLRVTGRRDAYFALAYRSAAPVAAAVVLAKVAKTPLGLVFRWVHFTVPYTLSEPVLVTDACSQDDLAALVEAVAEKLDARVAVLAPAPSQGPLCLEALGIALPAEPSWSMPGGNPSLEAYIGRFRANKRKRLRRFHRQLASNGLHAAPTPVTDASIARLTPLFDAWRKRHGLLTGFPFAEYCCACAAAGCAAFFCVEGAEGPLAFDLVLERDGVAEITLVGFDYERAGKVAIYEVLFLAELDWLAQRRDLRLVRIGQGAGLQKRRLGALPTAMQAVIVLRAPGFGLLRRLIGPALSRVATSYKNVTK